MAAKHSKATNSTLAEANDQSTKRNERGSPPSHQEQLRSRPGAVEARTEAIRGQRVPLMALALVAAARRFVFGKRRHSLKKKTFVTMTCHALPSPTLESQVIPHAFHCNTLAPTIILLGALAPCLTSLLLDLACIGAFVSVCLVTRAGRPTSIRFRKTETQFPKTGAHRDLPCVAFPCP